MDVAVVVDADDVVDVGQRAIVFGYWLFVNGQLLVVSGSWFVDRDSWILVSGMWLVVCGQRYVWLRICLVKNMFLIWIEVLIDDARQLQKVWLMTDHDCGHYDLLQGRNRIRKDLFY